MIENTIYSLLTDALDGFTVRPDVPKENPELSLPLCVYTRTGTRSEPCMGIGKPTERTYQFQFDLFDIRADTINQAHSDLLDEFDNQQFSTDTARIVSMLVDQRCQPEDDCYHGISLFEFHVSEA